MKTTDVYIEQVLMGLLVLLTAGLFFLDHWPEFSASSKDIGVAFLALGGSYLLGILYDRFADTLLQNLEQHNRLAIAIKRMDANEVADSKGSAGEDPFPEERLRIAILEKAPGLARYSDYLRTRIRLTRAIATILPALSVGLGVFLIGRRHGTTRLSVWSGIAVASVYCSVFTLNLLRLPEKLPKTSDRTKLENYKIKKAEKWWHFYTAVKEPGLIGALLLFGFLEYIVFRFHDLHLMTLAPAGLLATLFAGWVWYRVNQTQLTLLRDYASYQKHAESGNRRVRARGASSGRG